MTGVKFKPIIPKMPVFKTAQIMAAVEQELSRIAREVQQDFNDTTQGWETRVDFIIETGVGIATISTDNAIYGYVNNGTKPHTILPKSKKVLRFAGRGGLVYTKTVSHPGTTGKHYSQKIAARWRGRVASRLQAAISAAS